ncbi:MULTISPECIES: hypothetical protein [unclassified Streptomyces]|uniref:hypothetical protein n=1 Tax=unclassified Streptomyces TaxID=2593676 RepID=UPI0035DBB0A5
MWPHLFWVDAGRPLPNGPNTPALKTPEVRATVNLEPGTDADETPPCGIRYPRPER